MATMYMM